MIAIITHDRPHRKTQDLIMQLMLRGYSNIELVAIPFVERKKFQPIFKHRPTNCVDVSIEDMSQRLKISYVKMKVDDLSQFFNQNEFDHILIGGSGILPCGLTSFHKIINSHPGYLPCIKGLGALKWAIYNGEPIGVTTHYISDQIDEGELIDQKFVPVYFEDSFHSVAQRLYETEIKMLVDSIELIENGKAKLESLSRTDGIYTPNRRMSHHHERIMIDRFEVIRKESKSHKEI